MVSQHDVCALILRSGPLAGTRSLMLGAGAVLEKLQRESLVEFLHDTNLLIGWVADKTTPDWRTRLSLSFMSAGFGAPTCRSWPLPESGVRRPGDCAGAQEIDGQ